MNEPKVKTCSVCGENKLRVYFYSKETQRGIYKSPEGKRWNGAQCPSCFSRITNLRPQKPKPKKNMDLIRSKSHRIGRAAERVVFELLKKRKLSNLKMNDTMRGPDITWTEDDTIRKLEVKKAIRHMSHGKYAFYLTEKVCPNRIADDFIGIVLPDRGVVIETMRQHLDKCRRDGRRNITHICKGKRGKT